MLGFDAIATMTRSNTPAARRTRSWCPLVIGSKVPGYTALRFMWRTDDTRPRPPDRREAPSSRRATPEAVRARAARHRRAHQAQACRRQRRGSGRQQIRIVRRIEKHDVEWRFAWPFASQPSASAQTTVQRCLPASPAPRPRSPLPRADPFRRKSPAPRRATAPPAREHRCRQTGRARAHRSMRGCSQLNRVSRTRSGVGRISTPAGNRRRRPRCRPPMMRRTREPPPRARAPPPASSARTVARLFPLFFAFANTRDPHARRLPPFGAQAYPTAPNRQVRRIVLHGEGMRPD